MRANGIDVLVLGHSHAVIPFARIQGVLVTQAGKNGEQLGRVELTFTREGPDSPWRISQNRGYMAAVTDTVGGHVQMLSAACRRCCRRSRRAACARSP